MMRWEREGQWEGEAPTSVHETARHVLAMPGVTLGHHVGGFKDAVGDLRNAQLLVVGLLSTAQEQR